MVASQSTQGGSPQGSSSDSSPERQPFLAPIIERVCLNPESENKTYHLVLDLSGSDIEYSVGDCLGIYPENDPHFVEQLLKLLQASGREIVQDRKGVQHVLRPFLLKSANLSRISKKILKESSHLLEALEKETIHASEFASHLLPMTPRFYSIASSMKAVGAEAHLTVGLSKNSLESPVAFGTCSHYLCERASLATREIPIFLQRSRHFFLPPESDQHPIIMICAGTGIAPFRGFMQERIARTNQANNWLIFGERRAHSDFHYADFWNTLVSKNHLKLSCAFSRDHVEKVYVQHKMLEEKSTLWRWLHEKKAYIFVCGDADKMAKSVDQTLLLIIESEGKLSHSEAKIYLQNLRSQGRYQRDVY